MSNTPEGMISVEDFAKKKGITTDKAINMIKDGFYTGRKVGDDWFVYENELKGNQSSGISVKAGDKDNEVVVTDIRMSFISMVAFMVKWVIASIPAFIILSIIFVVFAGMVGGFTNGARY
jgi:hypothetical protein